MNPKGDKIERTIRNAGLKVTPSRTALLLALHKVSKPVSVNDIIKSIGKRKCDQVTVYRSLETFISYGIVKRIDFLDGVAYYELTSLGQHHHAVCTNCKSVEDIVGVCSETLDKQALKKSGFASITTHSLEFFGLCKSCAGKTNIA